MLNIINSEKFYNIKDNDIKLGQYFTPKYIVEEILEEVKSIIDKNLKSKAELICDNYEDYNGFNYK